MVLTHQRWVIYGELAKMPEHPSPELVYERVKKKLPSLSLATVYNTIKTFVEHGLVQEVSVHHGSLRLESNMEPHHHLVCVECKRIQDWPASEIEAVRVKNTLPKGFTLHRLNVEVLGLCARCGRKARKAKNSGRIN